MSLIGILLASCASAKYSYTVDSDLKTYASTDDVFNRGAFEGDNNGVQKYGADVDKLTAIKPSDRQYAFQQMGYYNFIHFGMNTFTGEEWGTGKEDPSTFNPTNLSTDQWCEVLKASGSAGIILTAKHHDGFCLFPSEYTTHDIASSPYKDGKGDIVKELSDSCKKYGLKFGLYLSPWDMHEPTYGKAGYNEFFKKQLTELLDGRYGEIFSLWFDGARGSVEDVDFDEGWDYDWQGYYDVIRTLQPNAVITICGPDVRWVGNEKGIAFDNEWCVVNGNSAEQKEIMKNSQQYKGQDMSKVDYLLCPDDPIEARNAQLQATKLSWYPCEVDVSIRDGWFYHKNQSPKSLAHLLYIYYKCVGNNSSLLLNIPPNKEGLISDKDVARLKQFGNKISEDKAKPLDYQITVGDNRTTPIANANWDVMKTDTADGYTFANNEYIIDLKLEKESEILMLKLQEDIRESQRVEAFDVYFKKDNGTYVHAADETMIGVNKLLVFNTAKLPKAVEIRIVFTQTRNNPIIRNIGVFEK